MDLLKAKIFLTRYISTDNNYLVKIDKDEHFKLITTLLIRSYDRYNYDEYLRKIF